MKHIKNIWKNTIVLLGITLIILYIVLKDDLKDIVSTIQNIKVIYLVIAIVLYMLSQGIKALLNYIIVNDKTKISFKEALKHNLITHYFNGITPFATGGQPMEIYMLTEHDIALAQATNYTVQSFIFYQIALVLFGLFAVLYNFFFHIFPKVTILKKLVIMGFSINIFVVVILLLVSKSSYVTEKISNITIKISKKINKKTKEETIKQKFTDYHEGFKALQKRKGLLLSGILLNIISLVCLYIIPYVILLGININNNISIINTLVASAYVYILAAFVPIPGSSGGIEYGFTQFFGVFIKKEVLATTLLLWRFITYYLGLIIGGIVFSVEKKVKK